EVTIAPLSATKPPDDFRRARHSAFPFGHPRPAARLGGARQGGGAGAAALRGRGDRRRPLRRRAGDAGRASLPHAQHARSRRAGQGRCIVEGFVDFDYEITLLTVRHRDGTTFCEPVGHLQVDGDYRESWMPQPMSAAALARAQQIARTITDDLGGWGLFGVEL